MSFDINLYGFHVIWKLDIIRDFSYFTCVFRMQENRISTVFKKACGVEVWLSDCAMEGIPTNRITQIRVFLQFCKRVFVWRTVNSKSGPVNYKFNYEIDYKDFTCTDLNKRARISFVLFFGSFFLLIFICSFLFVHFFLFIFVYSLS
jgi:hypothetical protein